MLALAFVFVSGLLCQFLLVREYCWQLLQYVGSASSHQPVRHPYECLFKLWHSFICDMFVQYLSVVAFTTLFFSFFVLKLYKVSSQALLENSAFKAVVPRCLQRESLMQKAFSEEAT